MQQSEDEQYQDVAKFAAVRGSRLSRLVAFLVGSSKRFCFSIAYAVALFATLLMVSLIVTEKEQSYQEARNEYLKQEIVQLDKQLVTIKDLHEQTSSLLSRYDAVNNLLGKSQLVFTLLDHLGCRIVPAGVFLTEIEKDESQYLVHGVASTAAQVTTLLRNMEDDVVMYNATLKLINHTGLATAKANSVNFVIAVSTEYADAGMQSSTPSATESPSSNEQESASTIVIDREWGGAGVALALGVLVLGLCAWCLRRIWHRLWLHLFAVVAAAGVHIASGIRTLSSQLRSVDTGNVKAWPPAVRLLVLCEVVVLLFMVGSLVLPSTFESLENGRQEEAQLKEDFLSKKMKAIRIDLEKSRMQELQGKVITILRLLPSHGDEHIHNLIRLMQANGLQVLEIKPVDGEVFSETLAEKKWLIKTGGNLDRIGKFADDLSRSKGLPNLKNYKLTRRTESDKGRGELILEATVASYRYMDEEELADQKRSRRRAGSKK